MRAPSKPVAVGGEGGDIYQQYEGGTSFDLGDPWE